MEYLPRIGNVAGFDLGTMAEYLDRGLKYIKLGLLEKL
jgi:hypothetical protein